MVIAMRESALWKMIFSLLQNERYAGYLLKALANLGSSLKLNPNELAAFHGGYDHMLMFGATGMAIKGEETDNTRLVADVIFRYREYIRHDLDMEINTFFDNCVE